MILQKLLIYILRSSIYGTLVGLIILLLKSTLLKRLQSKYQFLIWLVMPFKVIFPMGPQSNISIFNTVNIDSAIEIANYHLVTTQTHNGIETLSNNFDIFTLVPYLWSSVTIILLLWVFASRVILSIKINRSKNGIDPGSLHTLIDCKKMLGIKRKIEIIVQSYVAFPSLFGIIKPKIIITDDMVKNHTDSLKHIFLHELAHYKRCDNVTNYLLIIIQCLHWFNPIIWYIFNNHIRKDMELATDELALNYLQEYDCQNYGNALIQNIESQSNTLAYGLLGLNRTKSDIAARLRAISKYRKPKSIQSFWGIINTIFLCAVCLTSAVVAKPISDIVEQKVINGNQIIQPQSENVADYISSNSISTQSEEITINNEQTFSEQPLLAFIEYNTDDTDIKSVTLKTDSNGHFVFYFKNNSTEHPIRFGISKTENSGLGWDFQTNANNNGTFYYGGLEPNTEYIITIDSYCPGKYGINGKITIKGE